MTAPVRTLPAALDGGPWGARCALATAPAQRAAHHRIRHEVFVTEQGIFPDSDVDAWDAHPDTLHVLATHAGEPAGTVRLFCLDRAAGLWQGDRLAVPRRLRTAGVGGPLVRYAVAAAGQRGGRRMVAHIQRPNVAFFRRLGWTPDGPEEIYVGVPHVPMSTALGWPWLTG